MPHDKERKPNGYPNSYKIGQHNIVYINIVCGCVCVRVHVYTHHILKDVCPRTHIGKKELSMVFAT